MDIDDICLQCGTVVRDYGRAYCSDECERIDAVSSASSSAFSSPRLDPAAHAQVPALLSAALGRALRLDSGAFADSSDDDDADDARVFLPRPVGKKALAPAYAAAPRRVPGRRPVLLGGPTAPTRAASDAPSDEDMAPLSLGSPLAARVLRAPSPARPVLTDSGFAPSRAAAKRRSLPAALDTRSLRAASPGLDTPVPLARGRRREPGETSVGPARDRSRSRARRTSLSGAYAADADASGSEPEAELAAAPTDRGRWRPADITAARAPGFGRGRSGLYAREATPIAPSLECAPRGRSAMPTRA